MAQEYIEGFQTGDPRKTATTTGPGERYQARGDTSPPSSNEDSAFHGLTRGHEGSPSGNPFGIGDPNNPRDVMKVMDTGSGVEEGISKAQVKTFGRTVGRSLAGEPA
jgi:hypothetical protein